MTGELHWGQQMDGMEQSPESNEMPEVPEEQNNQVCGSIYTNGHVMDSWLWSYRSFEWWRSEGSPNSSDRLCCGHNLCHSCDAQPSPLDNHALPYHCDPCSFLQALSHSLSLSRALQSASQFYWDFSSDALLPVTADAWCLWLFEELEPSHLLDDEYGSILGLPRPIFGTPEVEWEDKMLEPEIVVLTNVGVERPGAVEGVKTPELLRCIASWAV